MTITYEEFERVGLLYGTIVKAEKFLRATKATYKTWAKIGVLQTSTQVTVHYTPEILLGKKNVSCINSGEKNIAGFVSNFLLIGFSDNNGAICLASVDLEVPNGNKLH